MIVDDGDMYIPINKDGFPIGVLFVEQGFDILKLKGMTIDDALVYLNKNNISFLYRSGVKGTLRFKQKEYYMTKEKLEEEAEDVVYGMGYDTYESDGHSDFAVQDILVKFAEPREKRIEELEAQIEKMKCGGNCKHLYHVNVDGCYDAKCDLTYCDCINCKDKWELRR